MKPDKDNPKMSVSFKLEKHVILGEFFLTITAKKNETVFWVTRRELRKLRDVLMDAKL